MTIVDWERLETRITECLQEYNNCEHTGDEAIQRIDDILGEETDKGYILNYPVITETVSIVCPHCQKQSIIKIKKGEVKSYVKSQSIV